MVDREILQFASPLATASFLLALAASIISCAEPHRGSPANRDFESHGSGFSAAQSLRFDYMRQADSVLSRFSYVRTTELLTVDEDGDTLRFSRIVYRHRGSEGQTIDERRHGPSRRNPVPRLFAGRADHRKTPSFQNAVPENPEFASARHRESYVYELQPAVEAGREILEIRMALGAEPLSGVQHAKLAFESNSQQVMWFELERDDRSYLYRSTSLTRAALTRSPGGTVVPSEISYTTVLRVPMRKAYRAAVRTTYSAFEPLAQFDR